MIRRWIVSLPNSDGYNIRPVDDTFFSAREIVLAADHDAEIERLRSEEHILRKAHSELSINNKNMFNQIKAKNKIISDQHAEIERLREWLNALGE